MAGSKPLMFHELASVYDRVYASKDYRGECRTLRELARRYGGRRPESWLDVACGTGRHLEILRNDCAVEGVDLSRGMLRIARRRLPGVPLHQGDMRSFDLGRPFDVVTCLFSAIGHLSSERDLTATFANFTRHLRPGGVAIVEPWIDPRDWKGKHLHLVTREDAAGKIVRLASSRRKGNRSFVQYHYLIGEPGRGVRHYAETDIGLMVRRERLAELMGRSGLRAHVIPHGFAARRGLIVGRRPPRADR
jgi:SAM-dependent methyltransferase